MFSSAVDNWTHAFLHGMILIIAMRDRERLVNAKRC